MIVALARFLRPPYLMFPVFQETPEELLVMFQETKKNALKRFKISLLEFWKRETLVFLSKKKNIICTGRKKLT